MFFKKWFSTKRLFSIFLVWFILAASGSVKLFAAEKQSIINIESAEKSEYKKDVVNGGDCILLTGNVKISVTRGSDKTVIYADKINYNRNNEMLFAEGNVLLEQTGGSAGGEKITADSLLFNTATLEGIFDNGRAVQTSSDAINLPSGSTLIVASNIFGRDSGGTIAFKSGELTFCDDESPHWKIKASRIWLLPGGEFAFFNARLFVGRIPLMYFPAFYYPKDELIFNPAFGYKFREGYFVNTTLYLYGRKPADAASTKTESSGDEDKIDLFSFMKTGSSKEQVREGLVLHNLDEDFHGDTTNHVKVMADYYSNLGYMVGADVVVKPEKYLSDFKFTVETGFSNTLFKSNGTYMPFNRKGQKISDSSNFMSFEMPFRYQADLQLAISKPFSLSLSLPIYSDPFFNYDFNSRAETMDWIDYLMSGEAKEDENYTTVSSFEWALKGNYTFAVPQILQPYITSLSISNFQSQINFSSKNNAGLASRSEYNDDSEWASYTPERQFFYPSQITPFKISGRISGTLIKFPSTASKKTVEKNNIDLTGPEWLLPDTKTENKDDSAVTEAKTSPEEEEDVVFPETALPSIATVSPSVKVLNGITYTLGYSISPDFNSQFSYASQNLKKPEDFEFDNLSSTYIQVQVPTTLTSTIGYKDSFLSLTDTFNFTPVYQKHPYINTDEQNGGISENNAKQIKTTDYNARKLDLTDTNALTFRPFYYTEHFSGTSLTWNTTVKMVRTKYVSDDVNNPEWEYLTTDIWDDECVTNHNLSLVLAAKEGDYSQQFTFTSTLPPQVDQYNGNMNLTFPYASFGASTGIKRKSKTDETWVKQNLSQSFSLKLFNSKLNLTQSYVYNLEEEEHDSFKFSVSGYGAQLAYTMSYTTDYEFNSKNDVEKDSSKKIGWQTGTDKHFQPYNLSFAYSSGTKTFKYWTDKISVSPSLSTSLVYDCIKPTSSYFTFIPAMTFKVNDFLNLTFSAESRNNAIYRYFCSDADFNRYYQGAGYRNFSDDLIDSFRFDDNEKREASNFKMKNFKIALTHDLDDWDFNCEWSVKPRLLTEGGSKRYDFSPYLSLSVSWRPMAGMKTEIKDEYGDWKLN